MISRFGESELVEATAHADPDTTVIVEGVLADALADADAEINSYLAARYALPLAEAPRVLVPVACDIARYRLWKERASDAVTERYKAAIAFLRDVSGGRASLGIAPPQTQQASQIGGVQIQAPCGRLTRDSLRDW